jgi:hypothetical protein
MNMWRCFIVCFFLLYSLAATRLTADELDHTVPTKLDVYVGSSVFGAWHVELHGHSLTCIEQSGREAQNSLPVTPTKEQWRAFRRALDDLPIWKWKSDYPSSGVIDGTQWRLEIAYSDRTVKAKGNNNYPDKQGKPSSPRWTASFQSFVAAVKKLLRKEALFPDTG